MDNISSMRCIVQEPLRDSTHWDHVIPRPGDIIIATCYKAGTTLTQQIVNLLLHGDKDFDTMRNLSPWVESSLHAPPPEEIETLPSPRFLKTHLHPQALPWREEWKYIYLARDGRDVGLSLYNHIRTMAEEFAAIGKPVPPVHTIPADFSTFWDQWVETGKPRWDFWQNVDSWWQVRHQPNVLLIHYSDLINNKPIEAERLARFLGCEWNPSVCERVCDYSSLEYMRNLELAGKLGSPNKNKQKTGLINKGTNGRWKDLLTDKQLERYEAMVAQKLEPACAEWLHHGGHIGQEGNMHEVNPCIRPLRIDT